MSFIASAMLRAGRAVVVTGVLVVTLAGGAGAATATATQSMNDLQVKAAFLFNFTRFVAWPAAGRPVSICIAGNAPLTAAATEIVRGRVVDGRPVEARALDISRSLDDCDLLYLADLKADDASAVLSRVRGPVLTVGETPRFLRDGGMVRIFVEDNRMRFQVNRRQADLAGLKISSQLLSLASQ